MNYLWSYPDLNNMKVIVALTDTKIKNSKPQKKPYKLNDGDGLYLLYFVSTHGSTSEIRDGY